MSTPASTLQITYDTERAIQFIELARPSQRNAMSLQMVEELRQALASAERERIRAIVLRGQGGHFCAGGDVQDMMTARQAAATAGSAPYIAMNRSFGHLLQEAQASSAVLIVVLEGAVLGGGMGLVAVSDVALAQQDAQFGLPETRLGLLPAQIAPFLRARIGASATRRLALLGLRFDAAQALQLGLVHSVHADTASLQSALTQTLADVQRCAPGANRQTKRLLQAMDSDLSPYLDQAAEFFAAAVQSEEGQEGGMAFMQKRLPHWAQEGGA